MGGHGRAEIAGGVADHEGGFGGGKVGGGDDEVAFVFAGGGVEDNEEVAGGWVGGGWVSLCVCGRERDGVESGLPKASMQDGIESKCWTVSGVLFMLGGRLGGAGGDGNGDGVL